MKRYILIAAAAFLALTSCSKDVTSPSDETGEGTYFTEGQQVTLTCGTQHTKVNGTENTDKGIDFIWEDGDKIKVTIGTASSEFTLISGVGKTATFTGKMPASGSTFDVQYPVTDPDLTSQTYIAGALPHNMMKFAKTGCTLGSAVTLEAQYSALRLNLYGWDRQVNSITVTNLSDSKIYKLSFDSAVTVGSTSESATPFLLVMPTGEYNFKVEVTAPDNGASTELPVYIDDNGVERGYGILIGEGRRMETAEKKTFTSANILNMPAIAVSMVWAPVNCGYDDTHAYGLLYQFGRKAGAGYAATWTDSKKVSHSMESTNITEITYYQDAFSGTCNTDPAYDVLYRNNKTKSSRTDTQDWYTETASNRLMNWPSKSDDKGYVAGKLDDPCPVGWRVPTMEEFKALLGGNTSPEIVYVESQDGIYLNGTSSATSGLFLPVAGYWDWNPLHDGNENTVYWGRYESNIKDGEHYRVTYWTSTVVKDSQYAYSFYYQPYNDGTAFMDATGYRGHARPVRCIYDVDSVTTSDTSISGTEVNQGDWY